MSKNVTHLCALHDIYYETGRWENGCPMCEMHQKLLEETQTKGVECDKCGWAMKFPDEPCRCELEEENKKLLDILSDARETLMSQHDSEDINIMLHRIYEVLGYEE
jgi:Zn ribbon nucleic-acid-binding protein